MVPGERNKSISRRKSIALAGAGLTVLTGCTKVLRKVATKGDDIVRKGDEIAQYGDDAGKGDEAGQSGDKLGDKAAKKVGKKAAKKGGGEIASDVLGTTEGSDSKSTASNPLDITSTFTIPLASISDTVSIEQGYYVYWNLDLRTIASDKAKAADFAYNAFVNSGPSVDFLLIPDYEFDNFEKGIEFRYYSDASSLDSPLAVKSGTLSLSRYYFIIDNTNRASITDGGTAEVSVEFEATEVV